MPQQRGDHNDDYDDDDNDDDDDDVMLTMMMTRMPQQGGRAWSKSRIPAVADESLQPPQF